MEYVAPTPKQIEDWTGVNITATGMTDATMQGVLRPLISQAQSQAALRVGKTVFRSADLDQFDVDALTRSVALITAAFWLRSPQIRKLTGDHEPLLVEDSREFGEIIDSLFVEATGLLDLVSGASDKPEPKSYKTEISTSEKTFSRGMVW